MGYTAVAPSNTLNAMVKMPIGCTRRVAFEKGRRIGLECFSGANILCLQYVIVEIRDKSHSRTCTLQLRRQ